MTRAGVVAQRPPFQSIVINARMTGLCCWWKPWTSLHPASWLMQLTLELVTTCLHER